MQKPNLMFLPPALLLLPFVAAAETAVPNPQSVTVPDPLYCATIAAINAAPASYTIIDARSPSEFDDGHIAGAVNVPFDSLDLYADALPADKGAALVTYCRTGRRATVLQQLLAQRGYTNISVVPGAQVDTTDAQNPVFRCIEQAD